jgi:hypothetical protein
MCSLSLNILYYHILVLACNSFGTIHNGLVNDISAESKAFSGGWATIFEVEPQADHLGWCRIALEKGFEHCGQD